VIQKPLPFTTDADDSVQVGGTRVTLDTIVEAFNGGLAGEEIAQQYSVLSATRWVDVDRLVRAAASDQCQVREEAVDE
jgi:hypothetical protein